MRGASGGMNAFILVQKLKVCRRMFRELSRKKLLNNRVVIADLMRKIVEIQNDKEMGSMYDEMRKAEKELKKVWEMKRNTSFRDPKLIRLAIGIKIKNTFIKLLDKGDNRIRF